MNLKELISDNSKLPIGSKERKQNSKIILREFKKHLNRKPDYSLSPIQQMLSNIHRYPSKPIK